MRLFAWFILLFIFVGINHYPPTAVAQTEAVTVERLAIDLWPDYDSPAVLVLLTGTLASNTPLPATLTMPLPAQAELHAVARITSDNMMTDDVDFDVSNNQLRFTLPDSRFRVEYYLPYTAVDDQHSIQFVWQVPFHVNQLELAVQRPLAASDLQTEPAAVSIGPESDGLTYHILPVTAVAANQPYTVQVSYTMPQASLSINGVQTAPPLDPSILPTPDANINWALWLAVVGALFIGVALVWQVANQAKSQAKPKPKHPTAVAKPSVQAAKQTATPRFCRQCGKPLVAGDKFCRQCGTAV